LLRRRVRIHDEGGPIHPFDFLLQLILEVVHHPRPVVLQLGIILEAGHQHRRIRLERAQERP
jgi:hypothetical protein